MASGRSQLHSDAEKVDQGKDSNILTLINFLRLICNHGEHLLPASALEAWKTRDIGSIDWHTLRASRADCDMCGKYVDEIDTQASTEPEFPCQHSICPKCASRGADLEVDYVTRCPKCLEHAVDEGGSTNFQILQDPVIPSAKVSALIRNLRLDQSSGRESDGIIPTKRYQLTNKH